MSIFPLTSHFVPLSLILAYLCLAQVIAVALAFTRLHILLKECIPLYGRAICSPKPEPPPINTIIVLNKHILTRASYSHVSVGVKTKTKQKQNKQRQKKNKKKTKKNERERENVDGGGQRRAAVKLSGISKHILTLRGVFKFPRRP
jgi:hypothetical protein